MATGFFWCAAARGIGTELCLFFGYSGLFPVLKPAMAVRTLADIYGPFDREAKRRKLTQLTSPSNTLETALLKSHELLSSISTNTTLDANSIENAQENQGTKGTDDHCGVVA